MNNPESDFLAPRLNDWKHSRSIPVAADLVNSAFVLNRRDEALEAARFLLEQSEGVPETAKSLASQIINPLAESERLSISAALSHAEPDQIWQRIHRLRKRLRDEPRNSACQARDKAALHWPFNASVTTVNLARIMAQQDHRAEEKMVFSLASLKQGFFNEHLLNLIISKLALDQRAVKNQPQFEYLKSYAAIAA